MVCEIFDYCIFFKNSMAEMPKTMDYIKNRFCFGEHESCARFRTFKVVGEGGQVPVELMPCDIDEYRIILHHSKNKQQADSKDTLQTLIKDYLK